MARYHDIADALRRMIRKEGLKAGAELPSDRMLAKRFGVSSGAVRMANELLLREGLIERRHGRGTFVAARMSDSRARTGRIGLLLLADQSDWSGLPLQTTSIALAGAARRHGYELVVERTDLESLIVGDMPRMVTQRSVDAFFTYGWYYDHHFRYLDRQDLPYMQLGNRPISTSIPQAAFDYEQLTEDLTHALLLAGRRIVWLDADPEFKDYSVKMEMLRGYQRAMDSAGAGGLHLCGLRLDHMDEVIQRLGRTDPNESAYIVEDWAMAMLPPMLRTNPERRGELLIAPMPNASRYETIRHQGDNIVLWDRCLSMDDLVGPALAELLDVVEGVRATPRSVRIELHCRLVGVRPRTHLQLDVKTRIIPPIEPADRKDAHGAESGSAEHAVRTGGT